MLKHLEQEQLELEQLVLEQLVLEQLVLEQLVLEQLVLEQHLHLVASLHQLHVTWGNLLASLTSSL